MTFVAFFWRLLQRVCLLIKHSVLNYAHPPPDAITVFPGRAHGIDSAMVRLVLKYTDVQNVTVIDEHMDDPDMERAVIWIHDAGCDDLVVKGAFTTCRYISRLCYLNPTTPTSALIVDSALERLASFTASIERDEDSSVVHKHLTRLLSDMELDDTSPYIGGMHSTSVCDLMYHASIQFALYRLDKTMDDICNDCGTDSVRSWWAAQSDISLSSEGGDTCDSTSEDE